MKIYKTFNLVIALLFAFSLAGIPATASAQEPALNPHIIFFYNDGVGPGGWVFGEEWPLGAQVTIIIDSSNTPQSPDFTTQTTVINARPGQPGGRFEYSDYNHDISPGSIITVSDTITTRSLQVSGIHSIDMDDQNDQITGITSPNRGMQIFANDAMIQTQSDDQGNWSGDFTGITDLEYYTIVDIKVFDNDGDMTQRRWPVPNPVINASPNQGFVYARYWPTGTLIHMTVARLGSIIYTSDATVGPCGDGNPAGGPCGPNDAYFDLGYFDSGVTRLDLLPGDVITLTGGGITRSMIVSSLQVTEADASTDTVRGIADPSREVYPGVCGRDELNIPVMPDSDGHWEANLAPYDLLPDECGGATQHDENGNTTQQGWRVPNPRFTARLDENTIEGYDWRDGSSVTLTVEDPNTSMSPDYTASQVVVDSLLRFELGNDFALRPGQTVTMSSGDITRTLTIKLAVMNRDVAADKLSGKSSKNAEIYTWITNSTARHVYADENGNWVTDYSTPGDESWESQTVDIVLESEGGAYETDQNGNSTQISWRASDSQQRLTSLEPAKVWVGLKNSDDVGTKFDLLAEVYQNGTLIGSGQLNKVHGGSSGFNNAKLNTIPFTLFASIDWPSSSTLSIKLYVRNTCYGNTHNSGTARLWYNDASANSQFGATIGDVSQGYFLIDGFNLSIVAGTGPRKTIDVAAGKPCSPFKLFGTWSITP